MRALIIKLNHKTLLFALFVLSGTYVLGGVPSRTQMGEVKILAHQISWDLSRIYDKAIINARGTKARRDLHLFIGIDGGRVTIRVIENI